MNRFMLTITVATAALIGAHNAMAQTILYTPPGMQTERPMTLGEMIAARIDDPRAAKFRQWLAATPINAEFDVTKGYTAFVLVDSAFDPANPPHPLAHYIVNDRIGLTVMQGSQDYYETLAGDRIGASRIKNSYSVEGHRVNGVIKNPEGVIYLIGGPVSAQGL